MRIKLEKKVSTSLRSRALIPIEALAATLIVSSIFVAAAGADPIQAYAAIFQGAFGDTLAQTELLVRMAPLVLTGLAVAVAFRAKFWNIGAEGQLFLGAMLATAVGLYVDAPAVVHIPLFIVAAFAGGALTILPAAYLKLKLKADEVVTTLMLNFIIALLVSAILEGPWRDPVTKWPQSPSLPSAARYPILLPNSRLHLGIAVAFGLAALAYFIMQFTRLGFDIKAVGSNPEASQLSGISVARTILKACIISGGLAGVAGAGEVAGIHYHMIAEISPGYGYTGIVIATLGYLHPLGVLLAALFFAAIINGSFIMSRELVVPTFLSDVVQGLALIFMLVFLFFGQYRIKVIRT